jgi:hypothetical protein
VNVARIHSLRRQCAAIEAFRDAMAGEMHELEYDELGDILAPTIDRILHELARLEQGDAYVPYPHPIGSAWWTNVEGAP